MNIPPYAKGLKGVIATETKISKIDSENGKLYYCGYNVAELVQHYSFEQVIYLLFFQELPDDTVTREFTQIFRSHRDITPEIHKFIGEIPPATHPMEILQSVLPLLPCTHQQDINHWSPVLALVAKLPSILASIHRNRSNLPKVAADPELNQGHNFLYMLHGKKPDALSGDVMDKSFSLHAEHGLNASTFTGRVVASTGAPYHSSLSAASGALFGPLHGGANERVIMMIDEIGDVAKVDSWIRDKLSKHEKIMGMGHRVYKTYDPRATALKQLLNEFSTQKNNFSMVHMLNEIDRCFRQQMQNKPVYPNLDFYSGSVYRLLGIPTDLFTPVFAAARSIGWIAHIKEQYQNNRLFRPSAYYSGPKPRPLP